MELSNDISIIVPAYVVGSGIALCAAVQFGLAGMVGERSRLHRAFSAVCACAAGHLYTSAGYYSASTVQQAAELLRWQTAFAILFSPVFFWFVALYTDQKRIRPWLSLISLACIVCLIANFTSPYGLRFSSLRPDEPLRLPWGESLARFTGTVSPWRSGLLLLNTSILLWAIWRAAVLFKRRRRPGVLYLGLYCAIQFATIPAGFLSELGVAHLFYTGGFAFLALVIFMSASLAFEFQASEAALRQRERLLSKSERQLGGIIDSAMDAIISIDQSQRILRFNASAETVFGCTAGEAIGQDIGNFIPERFRGAHREHVGAFGRAQITSRRAGGLGVLYGRRADGQEFPMEASISQFESEGEKFYTVIVRDITERYDAEEALRVSEQRFRNMADTAPVMIWVAGPDKGCTYFNRGWLDFTGRTLEQELGNGWAEGVHTDDHARCILTYVSAFDRKEAFAMEYRLRRADGEFRWVYDCGTPNFSPAGELMGYIGSCIDITEHKRAEETLGLLLDEVSQLKNQLEADNVYLSEEIKLEHNFEDIVGRSDAIKRVLINIEKVAPTDTTVLITGETGTGKELVARAIHGASKRNRRALVKVNCAVLPATLIESELFGHEKGAFTGAEARKQGRFELANGATIFLDEIGEVPLESQVKLLRVIQEGEFERLGSSKTLTTDARIIAATNRDLNEAVDKGVFRKDLWYRLNVFPITVPPLRERKEDLPLLVGHFVKRFAKRTGKEIDSVSPATMRALEDYGWPGNVRELANVIERAVISTQGPVLFLAEPLEDVQASTLPATWKPLEEMERDYIIRALNETGGKIEGEGGAAMLLGINPSTLRGRMAKLGIRRKQDGPKAFGAGG
jgi:PAS domain S-box-containing protein